MENLSGAALGGSNRGHIIKSNPVKRSSRLILDHEPSPVIYIFLGDLPRYARPSMEVTARYNPNHAFLLSEKRPRWLGKRTTFTPLSEFYSAGIFAEFANSSPLPETFRDGFWLKAAERLFVLNEFIKYTSLARGFHGELDCIFFDLPGLESRVEASSEKGVFFPRETEERGVASLLYFNSSFALQTLVERVSERVALGNEMQILGSLKKKEDGPFFAFPSTEYLFRSAQAKENSQPWPVVPSEPDSIVDGVVLGQWIFGLDRRNMKGKGVINRIQNHKNSAHFEFPLSLLKFKPPTRAGEPPQASADGNDWLQVHAIHVHSKIHSLLFPWIIRLTLSRLNQGKATRFTVPDNLSPRIRFAQLWREGVLWFGRCADRGVLNMRESKKQETKPGAHSCDSGGSVF